MAPSRRATALVMAACFHLVGCGGSSPSQPPPPPPSGTTINVAFAGPAPSAIAKQIGAGNWAAVAVPSNPNWSFTVPQGTNRYAIAYVCEGEYGPGFPFNNEFILQATTDDTTTYAVGCGTNMASNTVAGNVDATAIPNTAAIFIYPPNPPGPTSFYPATVLGATGPFNLDVPTSGTYDIAAVAVDNSNNVLGVKIVRSQSSSGTLNGGNPIEFKPGNATTSQSISVANDPWRTGNLGGVSVNYITANGTSFPLNNLSTTNYSVPASSETQSGDYYSFSAYDFSDLASSGQWIATTLTAVGASAVTLALPAPMTYLAPAPAPFPTFDYPNSPGGKAAAYSASVEWSVPLGLIPDSYTIAIVATSAFQNGATTLAIPDLTSLPALLSPASSGTAVTWATMVVSGAPIAWYSSAAQPSYNGSPPLWLSPMVPASSSTSWVQNTGTYVEP